MIVSHFGSDGGCDERDERWRRRLGAVSLIAAMSFIDANEPGCETPSERLR
jgi:hypothetical protein